MLDGTRRAIGIDAVRQRVTGLRFRESHVGRFCRRAQPSKGGTRSQTPSRSTSPYIGARWRTGPGMWLKWLQTARRASNGDLVDDTTLSPCNRDRAGRHYQPMSQPGRGRGPRPPCGASDAAARTATVGSVAASRGTSPAKPRRPRKPRSGADRQGREAVPDVKVDR